jgi:hypothetical protein
LKRIREWDEVKKEKKNMMGGVNVKKWGKGQNEKKRLISR